MKRVLALMLSAALLLSQAACSVPPSVGTEGGDTQNLPGDVSPSPMALTEPVYPDFPTYPQEPKDGNWDAYYRQYDAYCAALRELRGDGLRQEDRHRLNAFSGRSAPLALAGHEGENAIYSPLSLWSALAMLAQCAAGDSRQQVLDALGADSMESLQDQVSAIWRSLYTDDGASSLLLANSIWLNSSLEGSYRPETLAALGITDLLDANRADLSSLATIEAHLSGAKQLARVTADEEGVEAAAVTILMVEASGVMTPEDPEVCVMDLDSPFLFVIRATGIPLFVGVVNQL